MPKSFQGLASQVIVLQAYTTVPGFMPIEAVGGRGEYKSATIVAAARATEC